MEDFVSPNVKRVTYLTVILPLDVAVGQVGFPRYMSRYIKFKMAAPMTYIDKFRMAAPMFLLI
jgi:hypothetical protein